MTENIETLFKEFIKEQEYSSKLSPVTLDGYQYAFKLFLQIMPGTGLEDLTDKIMTEFFERLEKRERKVGRGYTKKGIKSSTVATYRSKLNKFFGWLEMKGKIKKNPFRLMEYPNVVYEDKKFLRKEELEKIFMAMGIGIPWKNPFVAKRNIAIITTLLYCGLRKGELLGLKVLDIDFGRKELTVRAETSKSRINRIVPLNPELIRKLEDYLEERKKRTSVSTSFFTSNNEDRELSEDGFKHLIAFLVDKSGVKFHAHQFRHTFAVNMLNKGCDIAKLKQLMGHKDIRMTASYVRCLPSSMMRNDVNMLTIDDMV